MSTINSLASTLTTNLNSVQSKIVDVQSQLATGKKNLNPAESGVVTRLSSQVTGYDQVGKNIAQAQNVLSVGQTALSSISSILSQMKQIATQASNSGLQASDAAALDTTFQQLALQVESLKSGATLNGSNVLTADLAVATGIDGTATTITKPTISALGSLAVDTTTDAQAALAAIDSALDEVSTAQSGLSASSAGLAAQSSAAASLASNLQTSIDSIQNIDQAALQMELQQLNNQQSVDYYLISQMNTAASAVLSIFR